MVSFLNDNERVVLDRGYTHVKCITPISVDPLEKQLHARIRARHKVCNMKLKLFKILSHVFRHNVQLHGMVFHGCSKIVFLTIKDEEPLFILQ